MRSLVLIVSGALALMLFVITWWLQLGRVSFQVHLPDAPVVREIESRLNPPEHPAALTGMRIVVPAIGVEAAVESLNLRQDGQMETPSRWEDAGWYSGGPRPGEPGVAIITGHVDSHTGPAVFYRLHQLKPGDVIRVTEDGQASSFRVVSLESYPESSLPTDQLLVRSGPSRLALLTCSGDFNRLTQRYTDRLLVEATQ